MSDRAYFPPLYGDVDCYQCEIGTNCHAYGKYQRKLRDFTIGSGRCPRLPDWGGFVGKEHRELYAATFPLIYAERSEDVVFLTLSVPGRKRNRKVYYAKSMGFWYVREKDEYGYPAKRIVEIERCWKPQDVAVAMDAVRSDYCIFRCELKGF